MDMLFDLLTVQQGILSYDQVLADMNSALESMKALNEGIDQRTWSGEGKEAFHEAFSVWQNRTKTVYADMEKSRESLVEYAANQSNHLKQTCEGFGDVY